MRVMRAASMEETRHALGFFFLVKFEIKNNKIIK
jgi:hypothetical protein